MNEIVQNLKRIEQELDAIRLIVKPMIPKNPKREDNIWECFNCTGGAASAVKRAYEAMERA